MSRVTVAAALALALAAFARDAGAQRTLLLSSTSFTVPSPAEAQFTAGVSANTTTAITWNVTSCKNGSGGSCVVELSGASFNGRPVSDLQYSTDNGASWSDMSTTPTQIGAPVPKNGTGSGTVLFRIKLAYTTDPPGTYTPPVTFTLLVQ